MPGAIGDADVGVWYSYVGFAPVERGIFGASAVDARDEGSKSSKERLVIPALR